MFLFSENRIDQFGRFIKNMDESVKAIQDRGQVHCEKCQGCKLNYFVKCEFEPCLQTLGTYSTKCNVIISSFITDIWLQVIQSTPLLAPPPPSPKMSHIEPHPSPKSTHSCQEKLTLYCFVQN